MFLIEFHSIPIHSIPLHSIPCFTQCQNEGASVFTTLYIIFFSDAKGQITPESVVVSGRKLNTSKLSRMSSSPARMKMIQSKMKGLEFSQHFFHYKSMEFFFQPPKGRYLCSSWSDLAEFRTIVYCSRCIKWMSSFPAKIKNIRSKMKALEWSKRFSAL